MLVVSIVVVALGTGAGLGTLGVQLANRDNDGRAAAVATVTAPAPTPTRPPTLTVTATQAALAVVTTPTASVLLATPTPTPTTPTAEPPPRQSTPTPTPLVAPPTQALTPRSEPTTSPAFRPLPALTAGVTYRDAQGRFSLVVPGNWTRVQAAGAEVAFQSPAPSGVIPATVNIVIEKLPSATVTLDEYDQAGEANLKQQFPDYRSVSFERVLVGGRAGYKRVYTATIAGRLLQLQQAYFIDNGVAYVVSCGAPQSAFPSYAALLEQITGSFVAPSR